MLPNSKNDIGFNQNNESPAIGRLAFVSDAAPRAETSSKRCVQVLKFGGTSMNGPTCIRNVAGIVENTARQARIVVVVSAMSGVTDQLLRLSSAAQTRNRRLVTEILNDLRFKHVDALADLVRSSYVRMAVARKLYDLLGACDQVCEDVLLSGELTLGQRDLIAGMGERLSAPLLAGALADRGVPTEAIEAIDLIVTNANFGEAEPSMSETRARCTARLLPLMENGVVPVITGFIGATPDGIPTTLGRNGSDYSATIITAGIDADEVVIWTDVDGFMTADPNVVPGARVIPELSYDDATELASFGAKVLHPKTLFAIKQAGLPLWIRKTFAPEAPGTKITPEGPYVKAGVRALASAKQVALVAIQGDKIATNRELLDRAIGEITRLRSDVVLTTGAVSQNELGLVVSASCADEIVTRLVSFLEPELHDGAVQKIYHRLDVGLVSAVGSRLNAIFDPAKDALQNAGADILIDSRSDNWCRVSFLVQADNFTHSVVALHRALVTVEEHRLQRSERASSVRCTRIEAYGAD